MIKGDVVLLIELPVQPCVWMGRESWGKVEGNRLSYQLMWDDSVISCFSLDCDLNRLHGLPQLKQTVSFISAIHLSYEQSLSPQPIIASITQNHLCLNADNKDPETFPGKRVLFLIHSKVSNLTFPLLYLCAVWICCECNRDDDHTCFCLCHSCSEC